MSRKIPFFNRKVEIAKFRQMLRNENEARGLVIHSHGERGWGKSQLMYVLHQECSSCDSPKTMGLFFDPSDRSDGVVDWKLIIDRTVEMLGRKRFPKYLNASSNKNSREIRKAEADLGSVRGQVDIADSDFSTHRGDVAGVIIKQSYYGFERNEDVSLDLAEKFFVELDKIDEPIQIVWLVDSLDWADSVTVRWLQYVMSRIVNRRVKKILLIVAGRNMLDYPASWQDIIEEIGLKPFSKSDLIELFKYVGLEGSEFLFENAAESLILKCGGRPLDVCSQLSSQL
jgi:hypothetical protein